MAIATAYAAVNMNNWDFWEAVEETGTMSRIDQYGSGGEHQIWNGSFSYDEYGYLVGGTVTGTTFIDGSTQYTVTGLNHNAMAVYNYLVSANPAVLSYLFSGNDTFNGSNFADAINGYNGNDTINGKGGADQINGGSGNDTIVWGTGDTVNGSTGTDTLKLSIALNLVALANNKITDVETINMTGGGIDTLTLATGDVLALSSTTNTIKILGDAGDIVNIDRPTLPTPTMQGNLERYALGSGAILLIEPELNVV